MHTYFEKEYQVILYDKANHVLVEKYMDNPPSHEFIPGMEAKIMAMRHFMTGKLICNVELLSKTPTEDRTFSATKWLQTAVSMGFSYVAIAVPTDMIFNLVLKDLIEEVNIRVQYFNNLKTAMEWTKKFE